MTTILHIDASAAEVSASHTRRLTADLVQRLQSAHDDARVVRRDLAEERLPHVDTTIRQAWMEEGERSDGLEEVSRRSRALVSELKDADIVVIGSPMYNFTVPSTLKAWIDHVAIAGQTFAYTEAGPRGLLENKTAYLVLSSGGVYSEGPAAAFEHLGTYLTAVMNFLGISDVHVVRAEGTALGEEHAAKAMEHAHARMRELVA